MNSSANELNIVIPFNIERQLFRFIEYFPMAVLLVDERFTIKEVNKLATFIIGTKREKIVGENIFKFIAERDTERFKKILENSFDSFIPESTEIVIKLPDFSKLNVLSILRCFKEPDNENKFCVLAIIDFTPQKMREEIIRESEARFKNMANTAPVMIWMSDVEGLFSFVNNVWLDYSGGELGQQLGMNWLNNVHPEDLSKLLDEYQNALKTREPFSIEFRFLDISGNYEWMLIKGKPRFGHENVYMGFIGSCVNIQAQKEIEVKISNLNTELIQTIAAKDKFFSIISHDLRSPLSGLMGILDILNTSYESMEENEIKEIIADASIVSKTTYTLMENLLEWSRIQTGTINYLPERLKIQRLVNNIFSLYEQNLKSKEIEFTSAVQPEHFIFGDKAMCETILRNLFSNAIKFTDVKGSILVSSEVRDDMVVIKVKDSGVGMNQENISNLFRVDMSFSTKGTADESGTGLGLIICKELTEKQHGKIWVESKKGEGATFCFSVPIG